MSHWQPIPHVPPPRQASWAASLLSLNRFAEAEEANEATFVEDAISELNSRKVA